MIVANITASSSWEKSSEFFPYLAFKNSTNREINNSKVENETNGLSTSI